MKKDDLNIMASVSLIENLKADLISIIGDLFKLLAKGSNIAQDAILECISGAVIVLYLLANRLGYSPYNVDQCVKSKLKDGIMEQDIIEKEGKDLSKLLKHFEKK